MKLLFPCLLLIAFNSFSQQKFVTAKSSGKLTMLAYGLGEDRLGGAKMGYIDTGVVLKIVDSTRSQYLVSLSKNRSAYVAKNEVRLDSSIRIKPFYLTNSWSVRGVDDYDYVSFSVDEKLPYKSWMEINPSKIKIELYGVQSNTNWITQLKSAKEVKNIYFNQVEDDVVCITIELQHDQHWGYTVAYKGKTLGIKINRQPPVLKINKMKIAIDAGHGGSNIGAKGIDTTIIEKNYTLLFAKQLEQYLKNKGANVIMTRTTDTTVNNTDRVLFVQNERPDLLISLHLNSSSNANAKGVSTYYKHIGFRPLTTNILERMLELKLNEFGNIGHFNFTLNALTDVPNALVEIAFLTNTEDQQKIIDPKFHKEVAKKVYLGIKDWLKKID